MQHSHFLYIRLVPFIPFLCGLFLPFPSSVYVVFPFPMGDSFVNGGKSTCRPHFDVIFDQMHRVSLTCCERALACVGGYKLVDIKEEENYELLLLYRASNCPTWRGGLNRQGSTQHVPLSHQMQHSFHSPHDLDRCSLPAKSMLLLYTV